MNIANNAPRGNEDGKINIQMEEIIEERNSYLIIGLGLINGNIANASISDVIPVYIQLFKESETFVFKELPENYLELLENNSYFYINKKLYYTSPKLYDIYKFDEKLKMPLELLYKEVEEYRIILN